ncbi:MAG: RCC1 domain-containing protein [Rhodoglobus sp.]
MSSVRSAGVVALSALIIAVGGTALASPASLGSGATGGGGLLPIPATAVVPDYIAANGHNSMSLGNDGVATSWGDNGYGQLGTNSTAANSLVPVTVQAPTGVKFTQISVGDTHSMAIGSDGNTYAWGFNAFGQLGTASANSSKVPALVITPVGVQFTKISAGEGHSLGLGTDGSIYAWGSNYHGEAGDKAVQTIATPRLMIPTPVGSSFTQILAGFNVSLAVRSDGKTFAWGWNNKGQFGNGTTTDSETPMLVSTPAGVKFTQVSENAGHVLAIADNGTTYGWGDNSYEQLGNGTTVDSLVPGLVSTPSNVTFIQVSTGDFHTLALGDDYQLYSWGSNSYGALGQPTYTHSEVPRKLPGPFSVSFLQVAAGGRSSMALGIDGNVYTWGNNSYGQVGNNSTTDVSVPQAAYKLPVISAVKFGGVASRDLVRVPEVWYASIPAHSSGTYDVIATYSQQGVADRDVTIGQYTYGYAPAMRVQPLTQTVTTGTQVVLTSTSIGDEIPTVQWQMSTDKGATWSAISQATNTTYAMTPTASGNMYRATFTNPLGSVTSDAATVTVSTAGSGTSGAGTSSSGATGSGPRGLAFTGSSSPVLPVAAALLAIFVGGGLLLMRRRRASRTDATFDADADETSRSR